MREEWTPKDHLVCWMSKKNTSYRTQWFKGSIAFRTEQTFIIRHIGGNEFNAVIGEYRFAPIDPKHPNQRPKEAKKL